MADATRVALLARPGEACERLRAALREAGGEIVLEGDPSTLAAEALSAAAPQTVLVALDPTVEDALDRFDAVLADPNVAVIFDEADLAARREGWDAARWVRHLSAKLHRHGDVLPPGREPDEAALKSVAPVANDAPPAASEIAPATIAESDAALPQSPVAEIIDDLPGLALEAAPEIAFAFDSGGEAPPEAGLDPADNEAPPTFSGLNLTDDIDEMSLEGEAAVTRFGGGAQFDGALDFDALVAGLEPVTPTVPDAAIEGGLDEFLASAPDIARDVVAELPPLDDAPASPPVAEAAPKATFDFGELSLVDQDETPAAAQSAGQGGRFQHDIADLERRIASMGLSEGPGSTTAQPSDLDSAATPPAHSMEDVAPVAADALAAPAGAGSDAAAHGAVLILAGIGGPDAVRQILSALPATFARPVLISQRLDGGRYDRLVQQMGRAAALPVQLAQAGGTAQAGHVYIVPPELGLEGGEGLRFAAGAALLCALPADDSAVLLLSGADAAQVEDALAKSAQGALVAGQSPEGCYDAAAPIALTTRGGDAGTPPELVQRLLQRWPA